MATVFPAFLLCGLLREFHFHLWLHQYHEGDVAKASPDNQTDNTSDALEMTKVQVVCAVQDAAADDDDDDDDDDEEEEEEERLLASKSATTTHESWLIHLGSDGLTPFNDTAPCQWLLEFVPPDSRNAPSPRRKSTDGLGGGPCPRPCPPRPNPSPPPRVRPPKPC